MNTKTKAAKAKRSSFPKIDPMLWATAGLKAPRKALAAAMAAGLALGGCATQPMPGLPTASAYGYQQQQAQKVQQVQMGTVLSLVPVRIQPAASGLGQIGGLAAGGFLGHQIGNGNGRTAATVIGALAGAIVGNRAEASMTQSSGEQVTVRLKSGQVIAVTQAADVPLAVGEQVQVVGGGWGGQPTRVMPLQTGVQP